MGGKIPKQNTKRPLLGFEDGGWGPWGGGGEQVRNGNRNSCSEDLGLIFYMKIHQDREKGRKEHGGGVPKTFS